MAKFFEDQPGTYLLTDFLVRSFNRTVIRSSASTATPTCETPTSAPTPASSGSPRSATAELEALAEQAASSIGLPLTVVETGNHGLEEALASAG